jgi:hypothetical protein
VTNEAGGTESARGRGISRRDALRKGAVVGGLAWSAPLILDSLTSRAFAVGPGSDPPGTDIQPLVAFSGPAITKPFCTSLKFQLHAHASGSCSPKGPPDGTTAYDWKIISSEAQVVLEPAGEYLWVEKKDYHDRSPANVVASVTVTQTCGNKSTRITSPEFHCHFNDPNPPTRAH